VPAVKSVPCRAVQRAEGSAQARPATCFGPARAQLGSGRAVLGPGQMTVLWAVPLARGLHAQLYLVERRMPAYYVHELLHLLSAG